MSSNETPGYADADTGSSEQYCDKCESKETHTSRGRCLGCYQRNSGSWEANNETEDLRPAKMIPLGYRVIPVPFVLTAGAFMVSFLLKLIRSDLMDAVSQPMEILFVLLLPIVMISFGFISWGLITGRVGQWYSPVPMTESLQYYREREEYVIVNEDMERVERGN